MFLLALVVANVRVPAQTFSTRNDYHDAMGSAEMGWTLLHQDSGYLVVQVCVDTTNIFLPRRLHPNKR